MPRLAIIGFGKMGHTIEQLAPERGFDVVARIDPVGWEAGSVKREALNGADVAVEFSTPASAPVNIRAAINCGCPIVVGTTGWYDERPRRWRRGVRRDRRGRALIETQRADRTDFSGMHGWWKRGRAYCPAP